MSQASTNSSHFLPWIGGADGVQGLRIRPANLTGLIVSERALWLGTDLAPSSGN